MLPCAGGTNLSACFHNLQACRLEASRMGHTSSEILPAYSHQLLPFVCAQGLADPHAKVRWAACQALGQLCTDLGPELQQDEHTRILPGLMAVMGDFSQPRVQAHAAAAVVNFSEHCEQVSCLVGHTCMRVPCSWSLGILQCSSPKAQQRQEPGRREYM